MRKDAIIIFRTLAAKKKIFGTQLKIISITNLHYGGVLAVDVSIKLYISLFKIVSTYLVYMQVIFNISYQLILY